MMSVGGVTLGAATYATWLRDASADPISYAPYLFVVGAALVFAYIVFGQAATGVVVVSEFGVSTSEGGPRIPWHDIQAVTLDEDGLTINTLADALRVQSASHSTAIRHLLQQAERKLGKRMEVADEDRAALAPWDDAAVTVSVAEPPQVTGMKCRASGRLLSVEQDVRMCARCGVFYHHQTVPTRCKACGKKLRSS
jgi:hypothetical protein